MKYTYVTSQQSSTRFPLYFVLLNSIASLDPNCSKKRQMAPRINNTQKKVTA